MEKFEYEFIIGCVEYDRKSNDLGSEGWEMITCRLYIKSLYAVSNDCHADYYVADMAFKRKIIT